MRPNSIAIDRETSSRPSDHAALRLWLRLLTCTKLVEARVRACLRDSFGTTLPRFDLMSQLDRYPDGLRMNEVSTRMMVTGANVTGITDQLEREGLVIRKIAEGDRRSFVIKLTAQGKRAFSRMAKAHEYWIQHIFSELPPEELPHLHELLATVKQSALRFPTDDREAIFSARQRKSPTSEMSVPMAPEKNI
jgi:DNA-binding MarR family transcriptional regulator